MTDTQRTDIDLEHEPGSRFWTLHSTFVLTNKDGKDIYTSRQAIICDRDDLERIAALIAEALAQS